jgi:hypothetical protein
MNRILIMTLTLVAATAFAQSADELQRRERCAVRVSIAITGQSPDPDLLASSDPQAHADALLQTTSFMERYSRFINTQFNRTPGATAEQDAPYYLAFYVLQNHLQWKEMFLGQWNVAADPTTDVVNVTADPNGLGYFRSDAWVRRYAGNEPHGVKLSTAYRIYNNTIGLHLIPSTNANGADITATGREATGCRGCHYDSPYALDLTASILSKKVVNMDGSISFQPPAAGAQTTILGGITVHDDKELVTTLVESEAFRFRTCRLAFNYLYGRNETTCDAATFDRCMTEFRNDGSLQTALSAIVKDPAFCQ